MKKIPACLRCHHPLVAWFVKGEMIGGANCRYCRLRDRVRKSNLAKPLVYNCTPLPPLRRVAGLDESAHQKKLIQQAERETSLIDADTITMKEPSYRATLAALCVMLPVHLFLPIIRFYLLRHRRRTTAFIVSDVLMLLFVLEGLASAGMIAYQVATENKAADKYEGLMLLLYMLGDQKNGKVAMSYGATYWEQLLMGVQPLVILYRSNSLQHLAVDYQRCDP